MNDQKDEELVALVRKNNDEEIRQVELRRCAAEERRYCWRNGHWTGAREKHQEEVTKPVSNEAASRMSLASDASAAAAEREL